MSQELSRLAGQLLGNAIVNQRGRQQAERDRIAARPPLSSFHEVVPPLEVEGWHDGEQCAVGYPWGWAEVNFSTIPDVDPQTLFVFWPERYDSNPANVRALRVDRISVEDLLDFVPFYQEEIGKALRLTPTGAVSQILVGGEPALLAELSGPGRPGTSETIGVTHVMTVHARYSYSIQLYSNERDYAAYKQAFWTMLGNWYWR